MLSLDRFIKSNMIYIKEWVNLCELYDYGDCIIIMYEYLKTMLYEALMKYAILIKEKKKRCPVEPFLYFLICLVDP